MRTLASLITLALALSPLARAQDLTLEQVAHPEHRLTPRHAALVSASWLANGQLLQARSEARTAVPSGPAAGAGPDRGKGLTYTRWMPGTWEPVPPPAMAASGPAAWVPVLVAAGLDEKAAAAALERVDLSGKPDVRLLRSGEQCLVLDLVQRRAKVVGLAKALDEALLSPDGKQVAYLSGQDIQVLDVATLKSRPLTTGGNAQLLNGRLDWVTQEEVYGRGQWRAFWWAPDSRRLAFLSLDVSRTPTFRMTDDRFHPQKHEDLSYPKPGEPNPVARLGLVDLEGRVDWMENPHPEEETLIVQVEFDPKGQLMAWWQNRIQNWAELHRYSGGRAQLVQREFNPQGWVERPKPLRWLNDGSFLLQSERTGHEHLYRVSYDGQQVTPLTSGAFQVRRVLAVDEAAGHVVLESNRDNPIGLDAYVLDLKGKAPMRRLTEGLGTHRVEVDPSLRYFIDQWSSATHPGQVVLRDLQGKALKVLEDRSEAPVLFRRGTVKLVKVPTRDGYLMDGQLILPPDFDPAKTYPVFQTGYAGPSSPTVRDAWNANAWDHFLAQQGYIVWKLDPRCASDKGMVYTQVCYRRLGAQELMDYEDGLAWLEQQGWADMKRVAIDGWSYGGFMAAYCATSSTRWKVAVVGAPVTDFRLYDSIYTERYMALPQQNPQGYDATSVVKKAADTRASVLILHGLMDENVHPQNSVMLLNALMEAGKDVQFVALPGAGHGPRGPWQHWHRYRTVWDFLQRKL
jgi:dipeptidyl-peptidase-4